MEIDIYWDDLTDAKKHELIQDGFKNSNVTDGIFPLTTMSIENDDDNEEDSK